VFRYDELLQAEDKAIKTAKGLHDKKNVPQHRYRYLLFTGWHKVLSFVFYFNERFAVTSFV
jgi:hypothetical protein